MKFFYLSSKANDDDQFLLHNRDCPDLPSKYERDYVGPFNSASEALRLIMTKKENIKICPVCCSNSQVYTVSQKHEL